MKDKHQKYFQELGKNLQNLRKTKGLSQQELANRCDVDRAKISSIETAKEDFVMTTLLEIAEALEVDLKSIKEVYESASIFDKHKLIRVVFQHNLTFKNTGFETPLINEAFYDNYLIANKKGLLFLEQPSLGLGVNPVSSP